MEKWQAELMAAGASQEAELLALRQAVKEAAKSKVSHRADCRCGSCIDERDGARMMQHPRGQGPRMPGGDPQSGEPVKVALYRWKEGPLGTPIQLFQELTPREAVRRCPPGTSKEKREELRIKLEKGEKVWITRQLEARPLTG